jgi:plastocyanin
LKRLTLTIGLLSLAAVLAACSGATASAPPASPSPATSDGSAGDAVTVTAKDLKFGQSELDVPADKAFDLVFDNQESAPHNVAIYTDSSASTKVSVGEVFSGPAQKTQSIPALAPGAYFFRCDVHPDMKGTITAQ